MVYLVIILALVLFGMIASLITNINDKGDKE